MQRLLNGLSWSALALVAAFCALQALEWVLAPASGVVGGGIGDMALGWLSRMTVFLVTGVTMLVTALVVLNAAGRAGRENFGVAVLAAVAGAGVSALVRYAIGATPSGEGAAYMLLVFTSWLGSGAILVAGYVFYLRAAQGLPSTARTSRRALNGLRSTDRSCKTIGKGLQSTDRSCQRIMKRPRSTARLTSTKATKGLPSTAISASEAPRNDAKSRCASSKVSWTRSEAPSARGQPRVHRAGRARSRAKW